LSQKEAVLHVKMVNDTGRLLAKVMNWSLPADRLSLMRDLLALTYEASGGPGDEDEAFADVFSEGVNKKY
jgi:hypothetical protein